MIDFSKKKVIVTGGAGFLGKFVIQKLEERNCKDIFVPNIEKYDLRKLDVIKKISKRLSAPVVMMLFRPLKQKRITVLRAT